MAPTIIYYRKVVNGVGYRFALPLLAPPPLTGDLVDVEVAIFLNDAANSLYAPPSNTVAASGYPGDLDSCVTLDISAAGAYWLLPLVEPAREGNEQVYSMKARRAPRPPDASTGKGLTDSVPTPQRGKQIKLAAPLKSRPAALASALRPRAEVVVCHSAYPTSSDGVAVAEASFEEARLDFVAQRSAPATTQDSTPSHDSDYTDTDTDSDESESHHDLFDEVELGLNAAYDYQITRTRYVDKLPKGDCLQGAHLDPRLLKPTGWSASKKSGTWFRLTRVKRETRALDWARLIDKGLPCKVRNGEITVFAQGCAEPYLEVTTAALCDGEAIYKLVPIDKDQYACQPAAASAEASFVLNNFHIVVEQNGKQHRAFEPAAKLLDFAWERHLRFLGEYASAECASSFIYSHDSHLDGDTEYINGFGVRLRDGGARLPLRVKAGSRDVFQIELPGVKTLFYDWGLCIEPSDDDDDLFDKIVVDVRFSLPLAPGACDLLLRVEERQDGDYEEVEYALRRRGTYRPVERDEWQRLTLDVMYAAAKRCMLNVARSTFDRDLLEEASNE